MHHTPSFKPITHDELHVITVISNPVRYKSRARLLNQFLNHSRELKVTQWVIEAVFGERPPEVCDPDDPHHIIVRCDHELWIKEALINKAIQHLPPDWKYVAWCDGDVQFIRADCWAIEVVHALQHYAVVQPWSHAVDLGPEGETIGSSTSFMCRYFEGMKLTDRYAPSFHPGYCWAWRRDAWEAMGGMIEEAICGAGDRHMACALIGQPDISIPRGVHPNYNRMVQVWAERAERIIKRNVGIVPGTLLHYFHGWKADRRYHDRWKILVENQFDPTTDLRRNWQGIIHLADNKPKLRDDLRRYFRARKEDAA